MTNKDKFDGAEFQKILNSMSETSIEIVSALLKEDIRDSEALGFIYMETRFLLEDILAVSRRAKLADAPETARAAAQYAVRQAVGIVKLFNKRFPRRALGCPTAEELLELETPEDRRDREVVDALTA